MGRSGKTRTGLIAALDVGSSKICCLIAQAHNDGAIRISGVGHHASLGIKSGAIVDMAAAQNSILTAVSAAEEMASERIREVLLSVAGSNLSSQNYSATCFVSGKEISENEIRRVLGRAGEIEQPLDRELLHCLPVGYSVDGTKGVRDPRGMFAEELTANMQLVTAKAAGLRNIARCIERCHLDI